MQQSIWVRMASALPICGTALAMWIEHLELGIAQRGRFVGLLRAALIGLIIATSLLVASEGVVAVFDVVRFWVNVHITSHFRSEIGTEASRTAAEELNRPYYERNKRPPIETGGKTNCPSSGPIMPCFWSAGMGRHGKLHFLLGVHDAVAGNHELLDQLFRKEWTYEEHIGRLDKFYADGTHADIPVIDAMREVRGR